MTAERPDEADVLAEWSAHGLTETTFPSGFRARLRLPTPKDLIVRGILPTDLVEDVLAYTKAGKRMDDVADVDPALAIRLSSSLRAVAADMVRQVYRVATEQWVPVRLDAARLGTLPEDDQQHLEDLATRAIEGEEGQSGDALTTFRHGADGAAAGEGGGAVRDTSVGDDRPAAPVGRPARRSGARRAPRGG